LLVPFRSPPAVFSIDRVSLRFFAFWRNSTFGTKALQRTPLSGVTLFLHPLCYLSKPLVTPYITRTSPPHLFHPPVCRILLSFLSPFLSRRRQSFASQCQSPVDPLYPQPGPGFLGPPAIVRILAYSENNPSTFPLLFPSLPRRFATFPINPRPNCSRVEESYFVVWSLFVDPFFFFFSLLTTAVLVFPYWWRPPPPPPSKIRLGLGILEC